MTRILGIVNVTIDSFSDGGRYLDPAVALEHALRLVADGADLIDLGAEATHPQAEAVPADAEIARLAPVIERLRGEGVPLSIDTTKPDVMRFALQRGAAMINDVTGFAAVESVAAARDSDALLVVMHAKRSAAAAPWDRGRAAPVASDPATIVDEIIAYFRERVVALVASGIARERLVLDPGMGLFLGTNAEASFAVLRGLRELKAALGLPLMVSVSRKSFIGAALGTVDRRRRAVAAALRPVEQRAAGTLAAELWAVEHGADYVRTHEVRPLRDALAVRAALAQRA